MDLDYEALEKLIDLAESGRPSELEISLDLGLMVDGTKVKLMGLVAGPVTMAAIMINMAPAVKTIISELEKETACLRKTSHE